jgi:hypothetical protein
VSTAGDDTWSGTLPEPNADKTDGPVATLARARDAARALRQARGAGRAATVVVRGGIYPVRETVVLDAADSGAPDAPFVIMACPGETVQLIGGTEIPADAFGPVSDSSVRDRLDADIRGQVREAPLTALGITELGSFPVKFRGAPLAPELFFNDERMTLARWPDEGWTTIAKIIEKGSCPRNGDTSQNPGVFEYAGDRPERWNVDAGVWLHGYYCFDWYAEVIKVRSIDTEQKRITFDAPAHYSLRQGNPSPRRYRAINVRLYFLPPAELEGSRAVMSTLAGPVFALNDTSYVTIRGFTVEATLTDAIDVNGGTHNQILACELRNTRELGIKVSGGTHHRIEACDVHDTGTGGVYLGGGDRKTLSRGDHELVNCHIWRFSRHQQTYANAVTLAGVGNRAAHCLIHDAPHQAVSVSGNDHVFEYNVVHHVAMETDDCGAFYKGRNPSCRGNIVRYNFWHNIGSPMGHGNAAIYFDDGDGGDSVIGNLFFRCGEPGKGSFGTVFSHGGHDLVAENNIFLECKRALGSAPWSYGRWKGMINGKLWQERLLNEVDITKPPYTTHYPALVGFMDPQPDEKRVSFARNNVIAMGSQVKSGNWQVDDDENWVTEQDPGFVNAGKGDFRLKPNAEVFRRLPGFKPIPFEKMGLYRDELRPSLPERAWTYPPPKPLPVVAPPPPPKPPKPKTGPPPVFTIHPATASVTVDGVVTPAEWNGADTNKAMLMAQDVGGNTVKRISHAWITYDENAIYIAVDSTAHPETKFDGSQWGADDAVEVSLRPVRKGASLPISVIRGYGNGAVQFGKAESGPENPKPADAASITYKAKVVGKGRWTCEFRIPFAVFGFDPAKDKRIAFNLSARKALDNIWLMWEGTRAHSYDVDRAGFLELKP